MVLDRDEVAKLKIAIYSRKFVLAKIYRYTVSVMGIRLLLVGVVMCEVAFIIPIPGL